jgi:hypothetical protein
VALVGLGESSEHALGLINKIVREAACPVIVLLHAPDPEFLKEASKRGVFAHISDAGVEDWAPPTSQTAPAPRRDNRRTRHVKAGISERPVRHRQGCPLEIRGLLTGSTAGRPFRPPKQPADRPAGPGARPTRC